MFADVLVIGAGLSGAVVARKLAEKGRNVTVVEKRGHLAGNCHDQVDQRTGIRYGTYGAHIFHTNDEEVWRFVSRFGEWRRYEHKVLARPEGMPLVPIPLNRTSFNLLFDLNLTTDEEAKQFLENQTKDFQFEEPANGKEMAQSRCGPILYDLFFRHYTYKQWDRYPVELMPSVLARIPTRTNTDDRYFTDRFQYLPTSYTEAIREMLDHPNIQVFVNYDYLEHAGEWTFNRAIFTGPIDAYFNHSNLPPLQYRSIHFELSYEKGKYHQTHAVVNEPSPNVPYTRTVEPRHFLNQDSLGDETLIIRETTNDDGEPYYPVPDPDNQKLYALYQALAEEEEKRKNVAFLGRLATYKYLNMDQCVRLAIDEAEKGCY